MWYLHAVRMLLCGLECGISRADNVLQLLIRLFMCFFFVIVAGIAGNYCNMTRLALISILLLWTAANSSASRWHSMQIAQLMRAGIIDDVNQLKSVDVDHPYETARAIFGEESDINHCN